MKKIIYFLFLFSLIGCSQKIVLRNFDEPKTFFPIVQSVSGSDEIHVVVQHPTEERVIPRLIREEQEKTAYPYEIFPVRTADHEYAISKILFKEVTPEHEYLLEVLNTDRETVDQRRVRSMDGTKNQVRIIYFDEPKKLSESAKKDFFEDIIDEDPKLLIQTSADPKTSWKELTQSRQKNPEAMFLDLIPMVWFSKDPSETSFINDFYFQKSFSSGLDWGWVKLYFHESDTRDRSLGPKVFFESKVSEPSSIPYGLWIQEEGSEIKIQGRHVQETFPNLQGKVLILDIKKDEESAEKFHGTLRMLDQRFRKQKEIEFIF